MKDFRIDERCNGDWKTICYCQTEKEAWKLIKWLHPGYGMLRVMKLEGNVWIEK